MARLGVGAFLGKLRNLENVLARRERLVKLKNVVYDVAVKMNFLCERSGAGY